MSARSTVAVSVFPPTCTAAEPESADGADGAFGATVCEDFVGVVVEVVDVVLVVVVTFGATVVTDDLGTEVTTGICDWPSATVVDGATTMISMAGAIVVVVGSAVTVIVVLPLVAELYVASELFVAETEHVPTDVADRTSEESEQPAEPADTNANDTEPEPEPPDVANVNEVPNCVATLVIDNAVWSRFDTVTVTDPVVADAYVESAAFVADTVQVPADVADKTAEAMEQPAEPADTNANDTDPDPEPPDVANVNVLPIKNVLSTILSDA